MIADKLSLTNISNFHMIISNVCSIKLSGLEVISMDYNDNPVFEYDREPSRDVLCIDCKSFYASVECVSRGLNPLKTKLVVMSYPSDDPEQRGSGLILASSPAAKAAFGISNVSRARDLPFPYPPDLIIAAPRMNLYMKQHAIINDIYRKYASEVDHSVFSVDETFLDVTDSLKAFDCETADQLAKKIQIDVYRNTGIFTTVGIGENPWLAKAALDLYSKKNRNMRAEIRYEDVQEKLWSVKELTDICGIAKRTKKRLNFMGIHTVYDLAHADYYRLKFNMGIIGTELYAKSWGIDRSFLGQTYVAKSKSKGNSQVLPSDYTRRDEVETVIKEIAEQVSSRLRKDGLKTTCVSLGVAYSMGYIDRLDPDARGFSQQMKIPLTNSTKDIAQAALLLFDKNYRRQDIRNIGLSCSNLSFTSALQLSFFDDPETQIKDRLIDYVVDNIRKKYGFKSIIHAYNLMPGARAIARSSLVGGHAGGMSGIEAEPDGTAY